jgi:hypothetical protein
MVREMVTWFGDRSPGTPINVAGAAPAAAMAAPTSVAVMGRPNGAVLYPNPLRNGQAHLRLNGAGNDAARVLVFDAVGNPIADRLVSLEWAGDRWVSRSPIDLDGLPSGAYLTHVESTEGEPWRFTGKMVVER